MRIIAAIQRGEHVDGWINYGTKVSTIVRQVKRAEAEERNARTHPAQRKAARQ
jgi:hypothetical protein